jgi:hypothetical protein
MGVLEQVIQMKKQGSSDEEIIGTLTRQKVSPREINEALKQAQIKSAVSDLEDADMNPSPTLDEAPSPQDYVPQESYAPATQKEYVPQEVGYSQEGSYAPAEQQEAYGGEYASGGVDTDTVMEIASQIFSERIKKIQLMVEENAEATIVLQSKIENISERLKKIETTIDKLQMAILDKVGSYGNNLEGIKKEMSMMQDSFSKMLSSPQEKRISVQNNAESSELPEDVQSLQKRITKKKM